MQISYPRLSYLPFLLPRLKAFFATSLIEPDNVASHDGWFSVEGVPLRWHYPVGLLYDLFSGGEDVTTREEEEGVAAATATSRSGGGNRSEVGKASRLPWEIELHFTDWPSTDESSPLSRGT